MKNENEKEERKKCQKVAVRLRSVKTVHSNKDFHSVVGKGEIKVGRVSGNIGDKINGVRKNQKKCQVVKEILGVIDILPWFSESIRKFYQSIRKFY